MGVAFGMARTLDLSGTSRAGHFRGSEGERGTLRTHAHLLVKTQYDFTALQCPGRDSNPSANERPSRCVTNACPIFTQASFRRRLPEVFARKTQRSDALRIYRLAAMSHSQALSRLTVGDRSSDMRWALRSAIDKFEREWNYDASYIRDMIDASPRAAWLFLRVPGLLAAADLVGGFGLAAPAAASFYTMSPGRIGAIVAAVVGLIGAVIGGLALSRSAGRISTGNGRRGAIVAMMVGLIGMALGGLALARSRRSG